jgi:hypothetical protein
MKLVKTQLTVFRPQRGDDREEIVIRLEDVISSCVIANIHISLEEFARVLTGRSNIDCTAEIFLDSPVGKKRECKDEVIVPRPKFDQENKKAISRVLAPYEVDGWKGREDDLFNSHRWRQAADGQDGISVSFVRYVDPEETNG